MNVIQRHMPILLGLFIATSGHAYETQTQAAITAAAPVRSKLLISGITPADTNKCAVDSYPLPDAEELEKIRRDRDESIKASNVLPPRFGDVLSVERPKAQASSQPSSPHSFGVTNSAAVKEPTASDPFPGMTKEVTVEYKGRTVRARVPVTFSENAVLVGLRREEAARAARSPLQIALESGDVKAVMALISAGSDVKTIAVTTVNGAQAGTIAFAASRWASMHISAEGNASKQKDIADRFVAIIKALLAAGADASGTYSGSGVLSYMPQKSQQVSRPPHSLEITALLLNRGVRLEVLIAPSDRPLIAAVQNGDRELLEVLLRHGHPTPQMLSDALYAAVVEYSWDTAIRLLEFGADPNTRTIRHGENAGPLLDLVYQTSPSRSLIKSLLIHKANPDVMLTISTTPLAFVTHDHELMEAFLQAGANPNLVDRQWGMTPLHFASSSPRQAGFISDAPQANSVRVVDSDTRAKSVALLLRYGANPNTLSHGVTPLMNTTAMDGKTIDVLLDAGVEINDTSRNLRPDAPIKNMPGPVGWALLRQNETLALAWLIKRGLNDSRDCSAVYYAAAYGQAEVLKALLDRGATADVLSVIDRRRLPVRLPFSLGLEGMKQMVIIVDHGFLPLHIAAAQGHRGAVEALLEQGKVAVDTRTPRSEPRLHEAHDSKLSLSDIALRGFLTKKRLHAAQLPTGGETALMSAAFAGRTEIVKLLLSRGAAVNARDNSGRSAVDYANASKARHIIEVLRLLAQAGAVPEPNTSQFKERSNP